MNPTFHPGWNYTIKILDFVDNGMGIFHSSGMVTYYLFVKDRHGVLHIQSEDSQDSIGKQQANNRRTAAEQQPNSRRTRKCWHSRTDFENGQWYDDASMTFNVAAPEEESMMGNDSTLLNLGLCRWSIYLDRNDPTQSQKL